MKKILTIFITATMALTSIIGSAGIIEASEAMREIVATAAITPEITKSKVASAYLATLQQSSVYKTGPSGSEMCSVIFTDINNDGIEEMIYISLLSSTNVGDELALQVWTYKNGESLDAGEVNLGNFGVAGHTCAIYQMNDGTLCLLEIIGDEYIKSGSFKYYSLDEDMYLNLVSKDEFDTTHTWNNAGYYDYSLTINGEFVCDSNERDKNSGLAAKDASGFTANKARYLLVPTRSSLIRDMTGEETLSYEGLTVNEAYAYLSSQGAIVRQPVETPTTPAATEVQTAPAVTETPTTQAAAEVPAPAVTPVETTPTETYTLSRGATEEGIYKVVAYLTNGIPVRNNASDRAGVLTTIPSNTAVDIISENGAGWGQVYWNGTFGWVNLKYTKIVGNYIVDLPRSGYITPTLYVIYNTGSEGLECRSKASADSCTFGPIYDGTVVRVEAIVNQWAFVNYEGHYGWCHTKYMRSQGYDYSDTLRMLRNGTNGNDVLRLQNILVKNNYLTTADGSFGPGTEAAVIKFQQDKGLYNVDGIVDHATWEALLSVE